MKQPERHRLHDHSDDNSGGRIAAQHVTGLPTFSTTTTSAGGASVLDDLGDVNAPSPADNDSLTWDAASNSWINEAVGASTLDSLTDVTITSATTGDRLRYNGSQWVNITAMWVPVMVEDGATGLWYVVVTGDGDAVLTEVP